jgi:hypothetical protein
LIVQNKHRTRPTVRFADLSIHLNAHTTVEEQQSGIPNALASIGSGSRSILYPEAEELDLEDGTDDCAALGRRDVFEVEITDGIFLSSKLLTDMLTETPHNTHISHSSPSVILTPAQPQKHQPVDVSKLVY